MRDSDTADYSGASSDASAAVLRFRSAGVTEILFLTHNAFEPSVLMQAANSQAYRPTYLLSTQQYPATLVGLVPPGQLAGALAVGWAPAIDLNTGYDASAQAQRCLSTLKARGRTFSSGTQALVGLLACDGVDLLKRAAERPGGLANRDALDARRSRQWHRLRVSCDLRDVIPRRPQGRCGGLPPDGLRERLQLLQLQRPDDTDVMRDWTQVGTSA